MAGIMDAADLKFAIQNRGNGLDGIPVSVQRSLGDYAANPDSYSARNTVFQNLYKADPSTAANIAGQYAEGYNGLLGALKQAYGVNDGEAADIAAMNKLGVKGQKQQAAQQGAQQALGGSGGVLPGSGTQSALSILQR